MYLETYGALYAVCLAQDLKRPSDIEQKQAWWDYHEHRDPANFIRTRGRGRATDFYLIIRTEYSGFPPRR